MPPTNRKTGFVDRDVQGALIFRIALHWCVFFAVTGSTFILLRSLLGNPDLPLLERIQTEISSYMLMAVLVLSLLPAFVLDTIRFSNRFVGPITRLRRMLRELHENGDVEQVHFRERDFWGDVAKDFNRCADLVRQQRQTIERLEAELAAHSSSYSHAETAVESSR